MHGSPRSCAADAEGVGRCGAVGEAQAANVSAKAASASFFMGRLLKWRTAPCSEAVLVRCYGMLRLGLYGTLYGLVLLTNIVSHRRTGRRPALARVLLYVTGLMLSAALVETFH